FLNRKKQGGYVLAVFGAAMVMLIAFVGMAVDTGYVFQRKRHMQLAADAGALGAAQELRRGNMGTYSTSAMGDVSKNGFTDGVNGATVAVTSPPATGTFANNANYVQVAVSQPQPTFFMNIFGITNVPMSARSTAWAGGAAGNGCIVLLHPSFDGAFYSDGDATVNSDCGMWIDSSSSIAIDNQGDSYFTGGAAVHVVGRARNQGTFTPTPITGSVSSPDPLVNLAVPSSTGLVARSATRFNASGTRTLLPGIYAGGINLPAGANVTLSPGLYYLSNGGLKLTSAQIHGTGVTMFFTGTQSTTPILADTISTLDLAAPTSQLSDGTIEGILFFVNRNTAYKGLPWCMDIQSNGVNTLQGALYFPTCSVLWQSKSNAYLGNYTIIIAQYLRVDGSGTKLKIHANYSGQSDGSPLSSSVKLSE
ncbi:MAG: pilus assembly protein TadG-related protein, partial [Bryobacteraceae bacterium]